MLWLLLLFLSRQPVRGFQPLAVHTSLRRFATPGPKEESQPTADGFGRVRCVHTCHLSLPHLVTEHEPIQKHSISNS